MGPARSRPVPPERNPDETVEKERIPLDVPLSPVAAARLEEGLASARRGEIAPWGDFRKYAVDNDE